MFNSVFNVDRVHREDEADHGKEASADQDGHDDDIANEDEEDQQRQSQRLENGKERMPSSLRFIDDDGGMNE